jgi:hypothetical protein
MLRKRPWRTQRRTVHVETWSARAASAEPIHALRACCDVRCMTSTMLRHASRWPHLICDKGRRRYPTFRGGYRDLPARKLPHVRWTVGVGKPDSASLDISVNEAQNCDGWSIAARVCRASLSLSPA